MRPRVAHVVESLVIGGAERLVTDLLVERGREATSVICLREIGPFGEHLQTLGFTVDLVGLDAGPSQVIMRLSRILRQQRIQLIHSHNPMAHLYAALASPVSGNMPVLMTKHGMRHPKFGGSPALNRWLMRRSQIVAVSQESRDMMQRWIGPGRYPVRYIPNGISLAPYNNLPSQQEARRALGWPRDAFLIGIVARVDERKGHIPLINAAAKLPGAMLAIAGDGPLRPTIEEHVRQSGMESRVMLLGPRSDVPRILAALDVFCLPSETEGLPMTLLEAMAASRPVVVTTVGAIPVVVEEGVSGLLIPPCDSAALERALLEVRDPNRAVALGRAARQRVEREFSAAVALRNYEQVYSEMLSR